MELCLTQYWSELKDATVNLKLVFHAVQPSTATLTFVRLCVFFLKLQ